MKYPCLILLLWSAALGAQETAQTIESISVVGAQNYKLSPDLVEQIQQLTGRKCDPQALDQLAKSIGNELGEYSVTQK